MVRFPRIAVSEKTEFRTAVATFVENKSSASKFMSKLKQLLLEFTLDKFNIVLRSGTLFKP